MARSNDGVGSRPSSARAGAAPTCCSGADAGASESPMYTPRPDRFESRRFRACPQHSEPTVTVIDELTADQLRTLAEPLQKTAYGQYLLRQLTEKIF